MLGKHQGVCYNRPAGARLRPKKAQRKPGDSPSPSPVRMMAALGGTKGKSIRRATLTHPVSPSCVFILVSHILLGRLGRFGDRTYLSPTRFAVGVRPRHSVTTHIPYKLPLLMLLWNTTNPDFEVFVPSTVDCSRTHEQSARPFLFYLLSPRYLLDTHI
jgi:hypothetical protein